MSKWYDKWYIALGIILLALFLALEFYGFTMRYVFPYIDRLIDIARALKIL